jgi:endo-alpha-N-acetylgalactosaminidase
MMRLLSMLLLVCGATVQAATSSSTRAPTVEGTCLSELLESEAQVGYGSFQKNGTMGYFGGSGTTEQLNLLGVTDASHTLSAHAPSHIAYQLDQPYVTLRGAVAVNYDSHVMHALLVFKILGDGKELWTTGQVMHPTAPVPFDLDLTGIKKLELIVETPNGVNGGCHSAWIEPMVFDHPLVVSRLAATASGSKVALSWQPMPLTKDEKADTKPTIRIERSRTGSTNWEMAGEVEAKETSFQDVGLCDATTYFYRLIMGRTGPERYSRMVCATTGATGGIAAQYLSELTEIEANLGFGKLGKGTLGFDENPPLAFKGVKTPHGLSMHPPKQGASNVSYKLGKKFKVFLASVAINDDSMGSGSPLTFKVVGDGKELWVSKPIKAPLETQDCKVDIAKVDRLDLVVSAESSNEAAHALWIEPQVTAEAPHVGGKKAGN